MRRFIERIKEEILELDKNFLLNCKDSEDELLKAFKTVIHINVLKWVLSIINLCNTCKQDFPGCNAKSKDIIFGIGKGSDNIMECKKYIGKVNL